MVPNRPSRLLPMTTAMRSGSELSILLTILW
jgi:hypothetical protein